MRNLIRTDLTEADEQPTLRPIPRQHGRHLTEREFTRHVREAGRKQRTLEIRVRRAEKAMD